MLRLAEQGGDEATQVDALLIKGRILVLSQRLDEAVAPLRTAESRAAARGRIAAAVIAGARRIYAEALLARDPPGLLRQAESLEPWGEAVARDPLARPLLLNTLGGLQLVTRHRDRAREYFLAAREARQRLAVPDPELAAIDLNLAMVADDPVQRVALTEAAWSRSRDQLGPNHAITLGARHMHATSLRDPERALPILIELVDSLEANHPGALGDRITAGASSAFYAAEVGSTERAARELTRIVSLLSSGNHPDLEVTRLIATGELALLSDGAVGDAFREVLAKTEGQNDFGSLLARAAALVGDGEYAMRAGDRDRAIAGFENAVALYTEFTAAPEFALRRARAQLLLAEALRGRPADAARRQQLVDVLVVS